MNPNKKDNNGWILCPSTSFPGKFYYFNVLSGEAAWCLNEADKTKKYGSIEKVTDKFHKYPEPNSPPIEVRITNTSISNQKQEDFNTPQYPTKPSQYALKSPQFIPNIQLPKVPQIIPSTPSPIFGQAAFPNYVSNVTPYMHNIIWTPIPMPAPMFVANTEERRPMIDHYTQTWTPDRELFVESCDIPLTKRFAEFKNQVSDKQLSRYNNKFYDIQNKAAEVAMTPSQIFGPIFEKQTVPVFESTPKKRLFSEKNPERFIEKKALNNQDKIQNQSRSVQPKVDYSNSKIDKQNIHGFSNFKQRIRSVSESDKSLQPELFTEKSFSGIRFGALSSERKIQYQFSQQNPKIDLLTSRRDSELPSTSFETKTFKTDKQNKVFETKSSAPYNPVKTQEEVVPVNPSKTECQNKSLPDFSLEELDENDLRFKIVGKRRRSDSQTSNNNHGEVSAKKSKENNLNEPEKVATPKKRVTFNLDFSSDTTAEDNGDDLGDKIQVPDDDENSDLWYLVVDTDVLLEDFDFIENFVVSDENCRLLIPHVVLSEIEAICTGESRGRNRVIAARNFIRKLATPPPHIVGQSIESPDCFDMCPIERLLRCCLQILDMNLQLVLVTNDRQLYHKAKLSNINCHKLKEIKDGVASDKSKIKIKSAEKNNNLFLLTSNEFERFPISQSLHVNSYNTPLFGRTSVTDKQRDISTNFKSCKSFDKSIDNKENFQIIKNVSKDIDNTSDIDLNIHKLVLNDEENDLMNLTSNQTNTSVNKKETQRLVFQIKNKNSSDDKTRIKPIFGLQNEILPKITFDVNKTNDKFQIQKPNWQQMQANGTKFEYQNENLPKITFDVRNVNDTFGIQNRNLQTPENIKKFEIQNEKQPVINGNESYYTKRMHLRSIEKKLERYQVKSKRMDGTIKSKIEEWICTFMQVMENVLTSVLLNLNITPYKYKPPWTLYEAMRCLIQMNELNYMNEVEMILLLLMKNKCDVADTLNPKMKSNDFVKLVGCGLLLLQALLKIQPNNEDVLESQQLLNNMLLCMEAAEVDDDLDLIKVSTQSRSDDDDSSPTNRRSFIKSRDDVMQYIKRHFPNALDYRDGSNDTLFTQSESKIIRTVGRNLNLLSIDKNKCLTVNQSETKSMPEFTLYKDVLDIKKTDVRNTNEDKYSIFDKQQKSNETKNRLVIETESNTKDKSNDVKEPKIVRLFNNSSYPNKNVANKINDDFNKPIHGNTFNEKVDGPKVIRNIKKIDEFEKRMVKNSNNFDNLEYSDLTETMSTFILSNANSPSNSDKTLVIDNSDVHFIDNEVKEMNGKVNCQTIEVHRKNIEVDRQMIEVSRKKVEVGHQNIELKEAVAKMITNDSDEDIIIENDSTDDSGLGNENIYAYTLLKKFLMELSGSFKLIYKFINESINEFRDQDFCEDKKKKLQDKATTTLGHLLGIIHKLECIIQRETKDSPIREMVIKTGVTASIDKRMTRYRQVIIKCLEQAEILENTLKVMLAIANGDYDVSCYTESREPVYFNIFE